MRTLDVGCGIAKAPEAVGIDHDPRSQADVVHDLNNYPWPLDSDTFDRILCSHIVEHVADVPRFMGEIHRLGKAGTRVEMVTPHFSNRYSYTDPTHVHHLSLRAFDFFTVPVPRQQTVLTRAFETQHPLPEFYVRQMFRPVMTHLRMARPFRLVGLQYIANRFPDFYELYLAFILPARDIYVQLEIVK
jgi:ubiquinone/menaquinone biosynthesis C-methylase UbiE